MNHRVRSFWAQHGIKFACWLSVAIGVALRIRDFASNRSLWLDEAMLVLNITSRGFGGLVRPLEYDQGAPLGFLLMERAVARGLGVHELTLRLLPLVAGIASILLLWTVARRLLDAKAVPIALALFALGDMLVYYSAEVKPYSLDVAVALAIFAATILHLEVPDRPKRYLALVSIGAAAPWLSLPSAFVMASALLALALANKAGSRKRLAIVALVWAASGCACFLLFDRSLLHKTNEAVWQRGFMPLDFTAPRWLADRVAELIDRQSGIGVAWFVWPIAGLGFVDLVRRNRTTAVLLVSPAILCFAVSALRLYSFQHRLVLFLAPLPILLVAQGLATIANMPLRTAVRIGAVMAVLWGPVVAAIGRFAEPHAHEEIKPALLHLQRELQPGDHLYVSHFSEPAFRYYWPRAWPYQVLASEDRTVDPRSFDRIEGHRAWILCSHVYSGQPRYLEILRQSLDARGRRLDTFVAPGVTLYLYEMRPTPTANASAPALKMESTWTALE